MTIPRRTPLAAAVLPILLAVAACGGAGAPTPAPAVTATATTTPSPSGTAAPDDSAEETPAPDLVEAAAIAVTGDGFRVVGDDGSTMIEAGYGDDAATVAASMAEALDAEPVVTTTVGQNTGCDSDQTMYDFGGIVLRSPGYVGSVGWIEVDVDGPATAGGVPIETVGGVRVGAAQASALAALGSYVEIYSLGPLVIGYDRINPEEPEYDGIGMLAEFDGGVLRRFIGIHYFFGDC